MKDQTLTETPLLADIDVEKLEKAAFILKTVAHPVRLAIIKLLEIDDRLSVSELCEKLQIEQSLTSHHLSNMKLKGILSCQREGKNIYYSIKERNILNLFTCLEKCDCNMG
ncbi:ArsR/SmtB family transcription factor [Hugenholtzia roseola]|uniref:ArsR/SmtB family transcription factor n=1 Tax=Hugenholtzia roseola TaxID=1002 RepID=UPI00041EE600|nr:metalloregulator ArsR/SmtB family transcription factor [Hugenholtzia roseola]